MTPTTPIWRLVLPITAMGIGSAFIWAPLAATATRNLPPQLAGAGSGVYNTTRQVGSVLGSAGMAAFMTTRISAEMPPMMTEAPGEGSVARLPAFLHEPFAAAMAQSLLLPAFFALFGVVAAIFLLGFGDPDRLLEDDLEDADRNAGYAVEYGGDEAFGDDDDYVEYTVSWDEPEPAPRAEPAVQLDAAVQADDSITEPMRSRADHVLHAPAEVWHGASVESWHSLLEDAPEPPAAEPPREAWRWGYRPPEGQGDILDELLGDVPTTPKVEPIGFAHNGFHVDEEQRFRPLPPQAREETAPPRHGRAARHYRPEEHPEKRPFWFESNGRHSREEPDDASSYGRHSSQGRD
jgi:hypothetical protein